MTGQPAAGSPRATGWHTGEDLRTGVHAMLTHQGYAVEAIEAAEQTHHAPDCHFDGQHWDCTDENGKSLHPLGDEIDGLAELLDVALSAITARPCPYDTDPAAHAWARARIRRLVDDIQTVATAADRAGRHDRAAALRLYAHWLTRDLLTGGEGATSPIPPVFPDPTKDTP